ncbi:hypothetical protein LCGC14_2035020 [marine sediment metagenome]|uniref:Uncharacterized protein n=1 Tax=marine sediment metagenome TaxID=412755 RepID=A0A0F9HQK6_9ZZZZ|tara:strand:+ start:4093 stop:4488 length:396 start_codon:yes stop_codon:yes gene_type:complete
MENATIFRYAAQRQGGVSMEILMKLKPYLNPDPDALDSADSVEVDVSELVKKAGLITAKAAIQKAWLDENCAMFSAQSDWHESLGHPLLDSNLLKANSGYASFSACSEYCTRRRALTARKICDLPPKLPSV